MNWINEAKKQRQWIDDHGGCLLGYIERYGSIADPNHYGNGGEAIYAADEAEFRRLWKLAIAQLAARS